MADTTKVGDELAWKLNPAIGTTRQIRETCALIHRHAVTLHRLAEESCNGPWWLEMESQGLGRMYRNAHSESGEVHEDRYQAFQAAQEKHGKRLERWQNELEARTEKLEKRLTWLIESLPETDLGPFKANLVGDPRGCSIIVVPDGCGVRTDDWCNTGVCI